MCVLGCEVNIIAPYCSAKHPELPILCVWLLMISMFNDSWVLSADHVTMVTVDLGILVILYLLSVQCTWGGNLSRTRGLCEQSVLS